MKVGFLITARLKSTRLPKKVVLKIENRELIRWMIDRLKLCKSIDTIVVCTSNNTQDDPLESIAVQEAVECFRGHEDDVILRLRDAAIHFNLDYVVNITADCPLVSVEYIDKIVQAYKETDADYITAFDLPHGLFSCGLKVAALEKVCQIKKDSNTEVWGRYFTETGLFKVHEISVPKEVQRPNYRLTIDYPEDYEFFQKLFSHMDDDVYTKDVAQIVDFLDKHKEIVDINAHCKEWYQQRWSKQGEVKI